MQEEEPEVRDFGRWSRQAVTWAGKLHLNLPCKQYGNDSNRPRRLLVFELSCCLRLVELESLVQGGALRWRKRLGLTAERDGDDLMPNAKAP